MDTLDLRITENVSTSESLWSRLLAALELQIPPTALESWMRPCRLAAVDGDHLRVAAPSDFVREWVARHHVEALQAAARTILGGDPRVSVEVDRDGPSSRLTEPSGQAPSLPPTSQPGSRYTFAAFVVGHSNQLAQAACQTVAELPSRTYNPLFIYGGAGLGKTHLLHAVGHEIACRHPCLQLLYLSTERFTNELISAIRRDRMEEFRAKYRTIDVLLIDDVQFIAGKERTQGEFFHTFNDLYEMRKQIVVTADSAPKSIPEIGQQLRSRFEWGLVADIQPPDFDTRVAIVKKKAEAERIHLPDGVADLIARRARANIREIEGALTRVLAFTSLVGRPLTLEVVRDVLSGIWREDDRPITVGDVQAKASEFFGVALSDLRGRNRTSSVSLARQVAMYLARQLTHASLGDLGRAFGGKDHTTVLHAVAKIQALIGQDAELKKTIDSLVRAVTMAS
ncbi:MAG TPA: chromosomal replication initiator protein DnaA [Candidatus Methylomirabilis sp.]|nr:chromosomal replication initiator protein DnaA [Candidatus Methylomirabilis sp.]